MGSRGRWLYLTARPIFPSPCRSNLPWAADPSGRDSGRPAKHHCTAHNSSPYYLPATFPFLLPRIAGTSGRDSDRPTKRKEQKATVNL